MTGANKVEEQHVMVWLYRQGLFDAFGSLPVMFLLLLVSAGGCC